MEKIAIISANCHFPGATGLASYWKMLRSGQEGVTQLSENALLAAGVSETLITANNYRPFRGILSNLEHIDDIVGPLVKNNLNKLSLQTKVMLPLINDLFIDRPPKKTAIYTGVSSPTIETGSKKDNDIQMNTKFVVDRYYRRTIAPYLAYQFGFEGPAVDLYTACSSSLVALTQACRELRLKQVDYAVAGAISIDYPQSFGYCYEPEGIFSEDGHCRAFDHRATGTLFSNGAGVVLLKRLSDAINDDDQILAVISGFAINNDGNVKPGFLTPGISGQFACITQAWKNAGVDPNQLVYIEGHGSSTQVGDPIELYAIKKAFQAFDVYSGYCGIGSVKSNIGHTTVASGMAGLIKTILMLHHKALVPTLHFDALNSLADLSNTPLFIAQKYQPMLDLKKPRVAGVSNFGLGGTNAHVILEEAIL